MVNVSKEIGENSTMTEQSSSIAGPKVFDIPELLEAIFLEVPVPDLLVSQRVNKQFKATVEHSIKIQRKLFYKQPLRQNGDSMININPMLVRISKLHSLECAVGVARKEEGSTHCVVCEFAKVAHSEELCLPTACGKTFVAFDDIDYESSRSTLRHRSFENMLIADSPILIMFGPYNRGYRIVGGDEDEVILTMHDLLAECRKLK